MTVMNYSHQVSTARTTKIPGVKQKSRFNRKFPAGNFSRTVAVDPRLETALELSI